MFLALSAPQLQALRAFLNADPDCEALSDSEYVADLYAVEPPISLNLVFAEGGVEIDGASVLGFDEDMDGYYMAEPIAQPEAVLRALDDAGALGAK